MSWDGYIQNQLLGTGHVKDAAIVGLDGSVWAASAGFTVSQPEITAILAAFKDVSKAQASGIRVNDCKYFFLRTEDSNIYVKKGTSGLALCKTNQAIIIGRYEEGIQPGQCNTVVGSLADYLKSQSY